jgi:hypothetical protein
MYFGDFVLGLLVAWICWDIYKLEVRIGKLENVIRLSIPVLKILQEELEEKAKHER